MTDIEFYDYFKSKSIAFNEMPSDDMWKKISDNLPATQPQMQSRPFLAKLPIILAILVSIILAILLVDSLTDEKRPSKKTVIPKISNAANLQIQKDTLPEKETHIISKKKGKPKIQTGKLQPFRVNSKKMDTVKYVMLAPTLIGIDSLQNKTGAANIPDTKVLSTLAQIVISSNKKLSKAEFDDFVIKSVKINEAAVGKILIVKAPGHKPFRTRIADVKQTDTIVIKE